MEARGWEGVKSEQKSSCSRAQIPEHDSLSLKRERDGNRDGEGRGKSGRGRKAGGWMEGRTESNLEGDCSEKTATFIFASSNSNASIFCCSPPAWLARLATASRSLRNSSKAFLPPLSTTSWAPRALSFQIADSASVREGQSHILCACRKIPR